MIVRILWLVLAAGNKTVSVTNITLCGLIQPPGTGSVALPFALIERSTADSAGTSSVVPAVNLSGTTVAAASAVRVYTANPTLGTTIGSIANPVINAGPSAAGCAVLDFGTRGASPIVLRGPQQLSINLGGVAVPSGGVLTYQIEVVER